MNKKRIIEALIYLIAVIIGICLLLFDKKQEKPVNMPKDYTVSEGRKNDIIPNK